PPCRVTTRMNRVPAISCLVREGRVAPLALLAFVAACGASPGGRPPLPPTAAREAQTRSAASGPGGASRPDDAVAVADFDALVAMVRRYHVFAPQTEKNLGKKWDDDLPRLRAEFLAAKTPE